MGLGVGIERQVNETERRLSYLLGCCREVEEGEAERGRLSGEKKRIHVWW